MKSIFELEQEIDDLEYEESEMAPGTYVNENNHN